VLRLAVLLIAVAALAGCGGSTSSDDVGSSGQTQTVAGPAQAAGGGTTLYRGGPWAVVVRGATAVALHFAGGAWHPDRSGKVKVTFLGPHPVDTARPQVAAELKAPTRLVESGMWLDGEELVAKGGGLSPNRGTIYGAPDRALAPGRHLVVAYARTAAAATAVARSFRVQ
jgi:hypothetical protein